MNTTRAILLAPAVLLSAMAGLAQTQTPPPSQPEAAPSVAPASAAPATTPTVRRRAVSPALAASLAETMPKYNPPAEPAPKTAEEEAAERPRNQIVRLPQVVVEGERPPVFTERQLYTQAELARLASRRYLSELDRGVLNRFTLPLFGQSAEQRAMSIYEDEERQRHIAEGRQAVSLLRQTDPAAARDLKRETDAAYIRPAEFTPTAGGRP